MIAADIAEINQEIKPALTVEERINEIFPAYPETVTTADVHRRDLERQILRKAFSSYLISDLPVEIKEDWERISQVIFTSELSSMEPSDQKVRKIIARELLLASYAVAAAKSFKSTYLQNRSYENGEEWQKYLSEVSRRGHTISDRFLETLEQGRTLEDALGLTTEEIRRRAEAGAVIAEKEDLDYLLDDLKHIDQVVEVMENKNPESGLSVKGLELFQLEKQEIIEIKNRLVQIYKDAIPNNMDDTFVESIYLFPQFRHANEYSTTLGQASKDHKRIYLYYGNQPIVLDTDRTVVETIVAHYERIVRHEAWHFIIRHSLSQNDRQDLLTAISVDELSAGYQVTFRYSPERLKSLPEESQDNERICEAASWYKTDPKRFRLVFPNIAAVFDRIYATNE